MDALNDVFHADAAMRRDDIDVAITLSASLESFLIRYRAELGETIHPWALPSLANAIGAIQHAISDLKAARHHIETPELPELPTDPSTVM